jgi:predicted CXXCH cytochrome family protein
MQLATADTVLGDFHDAAFTYAGVTSVFLKKGADYYVRTDGPDGALHEYRIAYTFGISPLQQYLIELPGGRLQAFGIAWDTREKARGGQRWFHLYPNDNIDFRDVLHWTQPAQTWNFMCADCHSTNVRKNYDTEKNIYATTWSDLDVACEACHGPGSEHVRLAREAQPIGRPAVAATHAAGPSGDRAPATREAQGSHPRPDHQSPPRNPGDGLIVSLRSTRDAWALEDLDIARLTVEPDTRTGPVCARCHALRSRIAGHDRPDLPFADTLRMSVLETGLYEADGQILDEVFEYGSFLQSRMHRRGVVCTDCHDPHSGRLRAEGNALCTKCHRAARYDTPEHHHHAAGTEAANCVHCHMGARTYMVVDERRDHSFRVPRPDLSETTGAPNTCTSCHRDRSALWAAETIVGWYGPLRGRGASWAPALAAARVHAARADQLLAAVIRDPAHPGIVRATALSLVANPSAPTVLTTIKESLRDSDPLVRREAASAMQGVSPRDRWAAVAGLLADPIRTVRLEAVNVLADLAPPNDWTADRRRQFEQALAEYRNAQAFNADRGDGWLNLGSVEARRGNLAAAEAAYLRGIKLEPSFMPLYLNLADLYRAAGREPDCERMLREALTRYPDSADVRHSLGLTLVRAKRMEEAVAELGSAAAAAPRNPRYSFVHALALDTLGRHDEAMALMKAAHQRFTGDRDILSALLAWSARAGDADAVALWQKKFDEID